MWLPNPSDVVTQPKRCGYPTPTMWLPNPNDVVTQPQRCGYLTPSVRQIKATFHQNMPTLGLYNHNVGVT
ncbi:hypothetical protein [Alistipes sp. ZOR0009]|uniref:hypothetical protein n=1 Tax=Alistipes sp. ZOR0009 TaxID=1339253 RepID=UPI0012E017D4|nr:hypothetical protein [Alistipes sp. ZOR0009]